MECDTVGLVVRFTDALSQLSWQLHLPQQVLADVFALYTRDG
jgi:hypothetical protein